MITSNCSIFIEYRKNSHDYHDLNHDARVKVVNGFDVILGHQLLDE